MSIQIATAILVIATLYAIYCRRRNLYTPILMLSAITILLIEALASIVFSKSLWIDYGYLNILFTGLRISVLNGVFNKVMVLNLSIVLLSVVIYSIKYIEYLRTGIDERHYWIYLCTLSLALVYVVIVSNLILFIAFLDIVIVFTALLISIDTHNYRARIATRLYVSISMLASALILLGFLIVCIDYGVIDLCFIEKPIIDPLPEILVTIGFIAKAGLFPFHLWIPRVHSEAPTPVSALASGYLVNIGLYGILLFHITLFSINPAVFYILLVSSTSSMLYASLAALAQRDLKKFIAYTTIAHNGYTVFCIALSMHMLLEPSIGYSVMASILVLSTVMYMLNHSLAKVSLFNIAGLITLAIGTRDIDKMGGLRKFTKPLYFLAILSTIALIGLPPSLGYIAKSLIHSSILKTSLSFLADLSLATLVSFLTATYMVKLLYRVFILETEYIRLHPIVERQDVLTNKHLLLGSITPLTASISLALYSSILVNMLNSILHTVDIQVIKAGELLWTTPLLAIIKPNIPFIQLSLYEEIFIVTLSLTIVPLVTLSSLWLWHYLEYIGHIIYNKINKIVYEKHLLERIYVVKEQVLHYIECFEENYGLPIAVSIVVLLLVILLIMFL